MRALLAWEPSSSAHPALSRRGQLARGPPWQVAPDAQGVRGVDVDLWPIGHRFDRGHCIRVQVASAAFPRSDRNLGTGEPTATGVRLVPADQEVFHDPSHPSHISLATLPRL